MGFSATAIDNGLFRKSQTHQGLQADFWGLKNLICFLLNKGSRSLASLTPKTQNPKPKTQNPKPKNQRARAGRQMPPDSAAGLALPPLNKPTRNGRRPAARDYHREGR